MRKASNFCAEENKFLCARKFPALRRASRRAPQRTALGPRLERLHEAAADFALALGTAQGGMSLVGTRAVGEGREGYQ